MWTVVYGPGPRWGGDNILPKNGRLNVLHARAHTQTHARAHTHTHAYSQARTHTHHTGA